MSESKLYDKDAMWDAIEKDAGPTDSGPPVPVESDVEAEECDAEELHEARVEDTETADATDSSPDEIECEPVVAEAAIHQSSNTKPEIHIEPGNLPDRVENSISALTALETPVVFKRGSALCGVAVSTDNEELLGCIVPAHTTHITPYTRSTVALGLARAAEWKRFNKQLEAWVPSDPCSRTCAALLEAESEWNQIPTLRGISETPILRSDGTLVCEPGYDPETQLYIQAGCPQFDLPSTVTHDMALEAADTVLEIFSEFPFVDEALDGSVILAYLNTMIVRPQIDNAPAFVVSATTPGSGKGLLIESANNLVRGKDAATMPPVGGGSGDEETRKRITALLAQGVASINIDNCTKPLGGDALNALLTTSNWNDRILGQTKTVSLPANITIAATGNNLGVRGDMVRRSMCLQLDPRVERPEQREFKEKDLIGAVRQNRTKLLRALFMIRKGYQQAGNPDSDKDLLGRFEPWTKAVCGPIRWLGMVDPLLSQERLREQDPEVEKLELLLSAVHEALGDAWFTAGKVIDTSMARLGVNPKQVNGETLREALDEVASDGRSGCNRRLLGWYLKHHTGRIVSGYRLERRERRETKSKNAQQYRVLRMGDPS